MNTPLDSPRSDHPSPIPPLSQSRHGDMACETLYVHKHGQCAKVGESEPAALGSKCMRPPEHRSPVSGRSGPEITNILMDPRSANRMSHAAMVAPNYLSLSVQNPAEGLPIYCWSVCAKACMCAADRAAVTTWRIALVTNSG